MNQIACASQNTEVKILPADVCVFGYFERLSFATVHSPVSQFDSRVKWWIHVFSHCHIFMEKVFVELKQLQTMLWIVDTLFFIDCEQTLHLLWIQLSHWQNGKYTAFWYPQLLCYLTQLQIMIGQNEFAKFFWGVFWDNCRIWATWVFSIICVCMTAFQVNIPPLNRCFRWNRVGIILIKPLLRLDSIFSPSESNDLSIHEIQIPSIKSKHLYTSVQIHCFLQP